MVGINEVNEMNKMDETDEKELLEKIERDKAQAKAQDRKRNLSIELETVCDEDLLKLIEEIMNDPLF